MTASSTSKPLKIAFVIFDIWHNGGAERHAMGWAQGLKDKGHNVKFFAISRVGWRQTVNIVNNSGYDACIVFHYLTHPVLPFIKVPTLYAFLEPPRAFYEPYITEKRPWLRPINSVLRVIDSFIVRRYVKHAVTNSVFSSEVAYRAYGRFWPHIYPGVDTNVFRTPTLYPGNIRYVLVVGATNHLKGADIIYEAVQLIPKDIRPRLVFVGVPHFDTQNGEEFTVLTNVSTEALVTLYQNARCVVCASIMEPYGLSAAESIACGTPVVAVEEGGFRETVSSRTGILCKRDAQDIANAIRTCMYPCFDKLRYDMRMSYVIDELEKKLKDIIP